MNLKCVMYASSLFNLKFYVWRQFKHIVDQSVTYFSQSLVILPSKYLTDSYIASYFIDKISHRTLENLFTQRYLHNIFCLQLSLVFSMLITSGGIELLKIYCKRYTWNAKTLERSITRPCHMTSIGGCLKRSSWFLRF